jgi:hypothetical protein
MTDFSGQWHTTFGLMELTQKGVRVRGRYLFHDIECSLEGKVANGRLEFTYQEPTVRGEGWFELHRNGQAFWGKWRPEGGDNWADWVGERLGFDGLWETDFGLLRLVQEGQSVHGFYEAAGHSTLEGQLRGNRLNFVYQEPKARGQGGFNLAPDGMSFEGQWLAEGGEEWKPWRGGRVLPRQGQSWLVVLENPWQRFLSEREYAFGYMLREFFARVPSVQVRHRFFNNEGGLHKCCRDLMYLAEPVALVVATHALADGLSVDGKQVDVRTLVENLRYAPDLRLLHFSACLTMQDSAVVDTLRELSDQLRLAISGYSTSVDWAASAIIEFTYLEMVLARGLTPAAAAEQLPRLLPFVADDGPADAPFRPAGFRIVLPNASRSSGKLRAVTN